MRMMPPHDSLRERIDTLREQALALRARVETDSLRARLDAALRELEHIPESFPEHLARQALLVPSGRIQTVLEIVGETQFAP
jgi:hypothetical protein